MRAPGILAEQPRLIVPKFSHQFRARRSRRGNNSRTYPFAIYVAIDGAVTNILIIATGE
jgi:hypothetical protein